MGRTAKEVFAIHVLRTEEILSRKLKELSKELMKLNDQLSVANDLILNLVDELELGSRSTVKALAQLLDVRDSEARGHSRRTVTYSLATAARLGLSPFEMDELTVGALLHDIGKLCIPDAILNKPGPLTRQEWSIMRRHPEMGCQLLKGLGVVESAIPLIVHHHERYDGSGYPSRLQRDEIPKAARIFAAADAFDAMTNDRPYRNAKPPMTAIEEIIRCRGTQFDPDVVDAFTAAWKNSHFEGIRPVERLV